MAIALLGAAAAAALAAAVWAHVDAAAGLRGLGAGRWIAVVLGAAVAGMALGWWSAPRAAGTLQWQQGQWTLVPCSASGSAAASRVGSLRPVFDLGGWMLLRFVAEDGRHARWLPVSRVSAGAAWHPLRATLFAPGASGPAAAADAP
ncbi:MAG: hypothetical protein IT390_08135 [Nitrospira sp.]|nr:hypothetical protein [Nitrospira sp.]